MNVSNPGEVFLGVLLRNERKNLEGGLPAFNEYLSCWEGGEVRTINHLRVAHIASCLSFMY